MLRAASFHDFINCLQFVRRKLFKVKSSPQIRLVGVIVIIQEKTGNAHNHNLWLLVPVRLLNVQPGNRRRLNGTGTGMRHNTVILPEFQGDRPTSKVLLPAISTSTVFFFIL